MASVIEKTRQGFIFQDKYALYKILEFIKNGRLLSAYVEDQHEDGSSFSHDIRLVLENPRKEIIYEVKTGEEFKKNKSIIDKAVEKLYQYWFVNDDVYMFIVTDKNEYSNMSAMQSQLEFFSEAMGTGKKNLNGLTCSQIINKIKKRKKFKDINEDQLNKFLLRLKLDASVHDISGEYGKNQSDVDNRISGIISYFSDDICEISSDDIFISNQSIQMELLNQIHLASQGKIGSNNLKECIINTLCDCLARRSIISKSPSKQNKSGINKISKNYYNKIITPGENEPLESHCVSAKASYIGVIK